MSDSAAVAVVEPGAPTTFAAKWTRADIEAQLARMARGEIPWREVWEVPGRYTAKEFDQMTDEDTHWEWRRGRILVHSPAGLEHQDLGRVLFVLLDAYLHLTAWGHAYAAPAALDLPGLAAKREPDIFALSLEKAARAGTGYCREVPELVVEVAVSDEGLGEALGEKLADYERAGVDEYFVAYAPRDDDAALVRWWHYQRAGERLRPVPEPEQGAVLFGSVGLAVPVDLLGDRGRWRDEVLVEVLSRELAGRIDPAVIARTVGEAVVAHLDPSARLHGLTPEERLAGLTPEQRLAGLTPAQRLGGLIPEEIAGALTAEARERLRGLLDRE